MQYELGKLAVHPVETGLAVHDVDPMYAVHMCNLSVFNKWVQSGNAIRADYAVRDVRAERAVRAVHAVSAVLAARAVRAVRAVSAVRAALLHPLSCIR